MNLGDFASNYLTTNARGDALVVGFRVPRLAEDVNIDQLGRELVALVDQYGVRKMVVTLRGIQYLTSSALGKLITLHRRMHRATGHVAIAELEPTVADILRASKLDTYLTVRPTVDEAVAAVG